MNSPLRVVLIGYGLGGRVFHAPLIRATPGLELAAIVTSDPSRQHQATEGNPGVEVLADPGRVWDRASEFDIAVIGGANITHVPQASSALSAGLHVVIDKPMAADAEQAVELAALAESMGRQLHPFQNRRWDSDYLTLKEVVASGRLGNVHRLESRIERLRPTAMQGWRALAAPEEMGGVLYDFGAHLIDQALQLLGPVQAVEAVARSVRDPRNADDDMQITMHHTSGAISTVWGSQVAAFGTPRFTVLGTQGGLRIDASDTQEDRLKAGEPADGPGWGTEDAVGTLRLFDESGRLQEEDVPLLPGAWPTAYRGIRDSVLGLAPAPVPVADAIANLRVLDAARAASARTVILDPPAAHR